MNRVPAPVYLAYILVFEAHLQRVHFMLVRFARLPLHFVDHDRVVLPEGVDLHLGLIQLFAELLDLRLTARAHKLSLLARGGRQVLNFSLQAVQVAH